MVVVAVEVVHLAVRHVLRRGGVLSCCHDWYCGFNCIWTERSAKGGIEQRLLVVESFELLMPRIEFTSAEASMDPGGNRARVAALINSPSIHYLNMHIVCSTSATRAVCGVSIHNHVLFFNVYVFEQ